MVKISTIFALGIFVAIIPFTGFPIEWKNFLYIISGLLVTILSVLIRKELEEVVRHLYSGGVKSDTFSDSSPKQQDKIEDLK